MSATDGRRWPVASATGVCLIVVIAVLVLATEIVTLTPTNLKLSHDRLQGLPLSTNFNALSCDTRVTDLGFIDAQTGVWVSTAVDGKGEGDRSEDCAQGDHLASLLDAAKTKRLFPEYLQNRTVLLLGDSFDRKLVEQLCSLANASVVTAKLNGQVIASGNRGDSRICILRDGSHSYFAAINVFHYGVINNFTTRPTDGDHWIRNESPLRTSERIAWIPNLLRSIGLHNGFCAHCGPETDETIESERKKGIAMAPFWLPDIFIAQSFMWDIAKLFEAEKPVGGNQTEDMHAEADSALQSSSDLESVSAFLSAWHAGVRAEILNPLSALLSNTSARLFARTIPLKPITANSTYHGVLLEHSMNRALRGIKKGMWRRKGWGIMDWEERVRGLEVYEDASLDRAHPNVVAGRVFWQMVLADLYQRTE